MMGILQFKKVNCKNCYKCVRNCPVKSIEVRDHQAQIIERECILCGRCTVVCPQKAKTDVSDLPRVKELLLVDDVWEHLDVQHQQALQTMIDGFKQKCGKAPVAYGTADNVKIKRIVTKPLTTMYAKTSQPALDNVSFDQVIGEIENEEPRQSYLNGELESQDQPTDSSWLPSFWTFVVGCACAVAVGLAMCGLVFFTNEDK
ncbi:MAG: hypothetical protein EOM69_04770, partial [Clostridia bacterium]|nr:hypothetical protein [Clostridia bacterium]